MQKALLQGILCQTTYCLSARQQESGLYLEKWTPPSEEFILHVIPAAAASPSSPSPGARCEGTSLPAFLFISRTKPHHIIKIASAELAGSCPPPPVLQKHPTESGICSSRAASVIQRNSFPGTRWGIQLCQKTGGQPSLVFFSVCSDCAQIRPVHACCCTSKRGLETKTPSVISPIQWSVLKEARVPPDSHS